MRSNFLRIGSIIRGVALSVPAVAFTQQGCMLSTSSCDGFQSQRIETRIVVPPPDAASKDAGLPSNQDECATYCVDHGGSNNECRVERGDAGGAVVICSFNTMCEGRRPNGYEPPEDEERAPLLGRYFAAMAAAEDASVAAFERMAAELDEHGLPARLAARALEAARDEARHFRMAAGLARKFGARVTRGRVTPQPKRTLLAMALENAREGVVRETVGAIVGHWQARHAGERAVRRVMTRIAHDEASHAVLSWAVHASARARLSKADRDVLDGAREDALRELTRSLDAPVPAELAKRAGVPGPSVARAILERARSELFGRASAWYC